MSAATASFWVIADTLGQIPIEVKAESSLAADAVSVPLLVKVRASDMLIVGQRLCSSVSVKPETVKIFVSSLQN
jgi:hypothetical protein